MAASEVKGLLGCWFVAFLLGPREKGMVFDRSLNLGSACLSW